MKVSDRMITASCRSARAPPAMEPNGMMA